MAVDNWKLWVIPFAAWGVALVWYSGYQSGYHEGHETAWEMAKPKISLSEVDLSQSSRQDFRTASAISN